MAVKIIKRVVDGAAPAEDRDAFIWDNELRGFGLKVTPGGTKVYVFQYHVGRGRNARRRRMVIGKHGSPYTPDTARTEAKRLAGLVADGQDPADRRAVERKLITFGELCDLYLAEGVEHKKASTLKADRGRIEHHLKPLLGKKRLDTVTRADIERLLGDVKSGKTAAPVPKNGERTPGSIARGGAGVAAQCVTLASTIFAFAVERGLRSDNPARGIKKPPVRKMERFLSEQEIARLAAACNAEVEASGNPFPAAAIKLLLLTGSRRSEIIKLEWPYVDAKPGRECLRLPDSKTGAKVVHLNHPATVVLQALPRVEGNPYVIAGTRKGAPFTGIDKVWSRIRKAAKLEGVRLHDLRHSYASFGAAGGLGLPLIGALLGHKQATTTARYAHLSDDPVRRASEAIGGALADAMSRPIEGNRGAEIITLGRRPGRRKA
ncbi:MAG TPA: tyrosine-type recombinase/integrase [Stellaceae bacterium]|nr:tyrosine-type recombinase/integrase [Stellaceae bacterium]